MTTLHSDLKQLLWITKRWCPEITKIDMEIAVRSF